MGIQDGFSASADSIDGSSHLLVEIAGLLYEGRMDGENATACRVPRSHPEVARYVEKFARFTQDQYADVVLVLAALSTRLTSASHGYTNVDVDTERAFAAILSGMRIVPPGSR